jgi:hypothetical protein
MYPGDRDPALTIPKALSPLHAYPLVSELKISSIAFVAKNISLLESVSYAKVNIGKPVPGCPLAIIWEDRLRESDFYCPQSQWVYRNI